jgi:hypothetical protein
MRPTRRPRILFLADRNILANQAYNAFSAFPEDAMVRIKPEDIRKKGRVPKNGSLFFTIFQEIIGRGTRLFEGKDYFTFYDFVKAHQHFLDLEWDGEPVPPDAGEACPACGQSPCVCVKPPPGPCPVCGQSPCVCTKAPCPRCGQRLCVCRKKVKVRLADGKARTIQHLTCTSFWHPDGTPMSAQQFMELLFGKLPEFFLNEEELRSIRSAPDTRKKLLQGLGSSHFGISGGRNVSPTRVLSGAGRGRRPREWASWKPALRFAAKMRIAGGAHAWVAL